MSSELKKVGDEFGANAAEDGRTIGDTGSSAQPQLLLFASLDGNQGEHKRNKDSSKLPIPSHALFAIFQKFAEFHTQYFLDRYKDSISELRKLLSALQKPITEMDEINKLIQSVETCPDNKLLKKRMSALIEKLRWKLIFYHGSDREQFEDLVRKMDSLNAYDFIKMQLVVEEILSVYGYKVRNHGIETKLGKDTEQSRKRVDSCRQFKSELLATLKEKLQGFLEKKYGKDAESFFQQLCYMIYNATNITGVSSAYYVDRAPARYIVLFTFAKKFGVSKQEFDTAWPAFLQEIGFGIERPEVIDLVKELLCGPSGIDDGTAIKLTEAYFKLINCDETGAPKNKNIESVLATLGSKPEFQKIFTSSKAKAIFSSDFAGRELKWKPLGGCGDKIRRSWEKSTSRSSLR